MGTKRNNGKRNNKKQRRYTKMTGGTPEFIKVVAFKGEDDKIDYRIFDNKMDKEQQKQYADKHKIYIPLGSYRDPFDFKKIYSITRPFFTMDDKVEKYGSHSFAINHPDDIKNIEVMNKIIKFLNNPSMPLPTGMSGSPRGMPTGMSGSPRGMPTGMSGSPRGMITGGTSTTSTSFDIPDLDELEKDIKNKNLENVIDEYKKYLEPSLVIDVNDPEAKNILRQQVQEKYNETIKELAQAYNSYILSNSSLNNFISTFLPEEKEIAEEILKSPVFLNIISKKEGWITKDFPNFEHMKKKIDNPDADVLELNVEPSGSFYSASGSSRSSSGYSGASGSSRSSSGYSGASGSIVSSLSGSSRSGSSLSGSSVSGSSRSGSSLSGSSNWSSISSSSKPISSSVSVPKMIPVNPNKNKIFVKPKNILTLKNSRRVRKGGSQKKKRLFTVRLKRK